MAKKKKGNRILIGLECTETGMRTYVTQKNKINTTDKLQIKKYNPKLTIINSTVLPGTTAQIFETTNAAIVHSPVRGVHARMHRDLLRYTKYIGAPHIDYSMLAKQHFESVGLKTKIVSNSKTSELTKLLSTTYYGVLIGWAQEVNRICKKYNCN